MIRNRLTAAIVALLGFAPALAFAFGNSALDASGPSFAVKPWNCHIQGQLTTDATGKCKFKTLHKIYVVAVKMVCGARSGAASDATFDVTAGGTSILTAKIAVDAAGTSYPTTGTGMTGAPLAIAAGTIVSVDWDRNNSGTADNCDITIWHRCPVAAEAQ